MDDTLGNGILVDRNFGLHVLLDLCHVGRDRWGLLRGGDLEQPTCESAPLYLERHFFLRHHNSNRCLLLLAHSGRHSSSGKRDGRSRIERRSDPVRSTSDQCHQNHDPCQRILRRHAFSRHLLFPYRI